MPVQPQTELRLTLKGDASLAGFETQQAGEFALCLGQIASVTTRLSLNASLPESARAALVAAGASLSSENGMSIVSFSRTLSLADLLAGIELRLAHLPAAAAISGETRFFGAAHQDLGFIRWQGVLSGSAQQIAILLRPVGPVMTGVACPRLEAVISGAEAGETGGTITPGPVLSPSPSASASTLRPLGLPAGLTLVEQTGSSLTLQWETAIEARSYRLYLDGQLVQGEHTYPDYFRFEGLRASTSYILGVQAIGEGGESPIAVLTAATLASGSSGSGNFSGGGGSRPRSTASPSVSPSPSDSPSPSPSPSDFQVNTFVTDAQINPAIAMDPDGDFIITWGGYAQDGFSSGVFAQLFNSAGQPQGSEFRVNTYTGGTEGRPRVEMDASGGFVITWRGNNHDGSDYGVYAQRYSSTGGVLGSEFQVNTFTGNNQVEPDIAMEANGDFVIVWESQPSQDGSGIGIFAQRYESDGDRIGSEFKVNTYTISNQSTPAIAMDNDGDFVVTWTDNGQDGNSDGIFGQRFTSGGASVGSEFLVNTYVSGRQTRSSVDMDAAGDFVVIWESENQDGSSYGIFGQRYSSSGSRSGSEFRVNDYTTNGQHLASVAMESDGDFVVTWDRFIPFNSIYGVYGQRFASTGATVGSEFQVNITTSATVLAPAVAVDADGDFVITWITGLGGAGAEIFARIFDIQP